jgi:predicted phosphodiesterase
MKCLAFCRSHAQPSSLQSSLSASVEGVTYLDHIYRVLCISDLHTDHAANMLWLENRTAHGDDLGENDLIVVAGDISHDIDTLEQTLALLLKRQCSVLFVPGNHEAWLNAKELHDGNSIQKLAKVYEACERLGVLTGCTVVGGTTETSNPLWIIPLESWYDGSLTIESCEDLCQDFGKWPWVDFIRCRWPDNFPPMTGTNAKIPSGLAEFFRERNKAIIHNAMASFEQFPAPDASRAVMTVSHFLPNSRCLPDWKNVDSPEFLRDDWLEHGGGQMSAKFAKVAGTKILDEQIRSDLKLPEDMRQIHVFGHSHRPKDFDYEKIRYIHHPLGKPRERSMHMVSPDVDFLHVWDTRQKSEIPGETVIRYWEEKGGGLERLWERMANSTRGNRYGRHHMKMKSSSGQIHQKRNKD